MSQNPILNELPEDHPLRNTPLGQINAKYRWVGDAPSVPWRTVQVGAPKLVGFTFNQLGAAWTDHDIWAVEN